MPISDGYVDFLLSVNLCRSMVKTATSQNGDRSKRRMFRNTTPATPAPKIQPTLTQPAGVAGVVFLYTENGDRNGYIQNSDKPKQHLQF